MEETADLPAALEAWRAIISQGRMTSTYKLALAACLGRFVQQGRVRVSRRELAEAFLDVYLARLVSSAGTGMPQLADPTKRSVVEQAVYQLVSERIARDQAVERLRREAFADVLPRFHTVGPAQVPVRFFTYDEDYLNLTTHALEVLSDEIRCAGLMREIELRWEEQEIKFEINRNRQHDCVFCNHRGNVLENDLALAVYDAFPVSPGHMLIIPKRHFPSFFDASEDEREALLELVYDARTLLDQEYHPDGYNIGVNVGRAAGQTIMHAHIHLIPRHRGDVADPRGGVRGVIPERRVYQVNLEKLRHEKSSDHGTPWKDQEPIPVDPVSRERNNRSSNGFPARRLPTMPYNTMAAEMIRAVNDEIVAIKEGGGGRDIPRVRRCQDGSIRRLPSLQVRSRIRTDGS